MDILKLLNEIEMLFLDMAPYMMLGLFFVGLLSFFFKKDMIARQIGKNNFWSIFKAALFGVPLPLCSCGVIPTSVYLSKSGASKSSVIAFLISTPQTGIDSMIATYGMLGWIFAIFRPIVALIMGVLGGFVVKYVDKDNSSKEIISGANTATLKEANTDNNIFLNAYNVGKYAFGEFLDDISTHFVIGLIIAGLISYFIPDDFFSGTVLNKGILGMILMVSIGIPMYVCATASIPIAVSLMMKGFSPGLAFVFLVTGPATNAASLAVLFKVLGKKITITYLLVIIIASIIFGYILDFIFALLHADPMQTMKHIHSHDGMMNMNLQIVLGVIFLILLLLSFYRKYFVNLFNKKGTKMEKEMQNSVIIDGMSCNHCVANVKKAAMTIYGIKNIEIDLSKKTAYIEGDYDFDQFKKAVEDIGYKVSK